jgi:type I restriction enzyme S subunit
VTRGVRGERPLKASGLSWVEELPAGWGTPTVSANFELQLGKMLNADAASGPNQAPYLRNVNVQWDRFDLDDLATMQFDPYDRVRCRLRKGDLLVCEGGEVGRAAVWSDELDNCFYQKAIHRVRPVDGANSRFLMYCLRAAAKLSVFEVEGNQSTIAHLTGEQLRVRRFPWPPRAEQVEIVNHLDKEGRYREQVTSTLRRQTELLEEHRQALITAAVTGAFEVPGAAA